MLDRLPPGADKDRLTERVAKAKALWAPFAKIRQATEFVYPWLDY